MTYIEDQHIRPAQLGEMLQAHIAKQSFEETVQYYHKTWASTEDYKDLHVSFTGFLIGNTSAAKYTSLEFNYYGTGTMSLLAVRIHLQEALERLYGKRVFDKSIQLGPFPELLRLGIESEEYPLKDWFDIWVSEIKRFYIPFYKRIHTLRDQYEYMKLSWPFLFTHDMQMNKFHDIYFWVKIFEPKLLPLMDLSYREYIRKGFRSNLKHFYKDEHLENILLIKDAEYEAGKIDQSREQLLKSGRLTEQDFVLSGPVSDLRKLLFTANKERHNNCWIPKYETCYKDFVERHPSYYQE